MIFAIALLLNSCTTDEFDTQEINTTNKKKTLIVPDDIKGEVNSTVIDSSGVNYKTLDIDPDGDPFNPKGK